MRDVPGHDVNYLSYAGVLGLCGSRRCDDPTLLPVQVGDVFGGSMMALSGILMALLGRERTGKGGRVDVSMTDGAMASLAIAGGLLARRRRAAGARLPAVDRDVPLLRGVPSARTASFVERRRRSKPWFWKALTSPGRGREDLGRTAVRGGGVGGGGAPRKCCGRSSSDRHAGRVGAAASRGSDACVSPVLDARRRRCSHPNTASRRMVVDVGSPLGGTERQLGLPIKIDGVPEERARRRAPAPGGTRRSEILEGLGYTGERDRRPAREGRDPEREGRGAGAADG